MNNTQRKLITNMEGKFTKERSSHRKNTKGNRGSYPKSGQSDPPRVWSRYDPRPLQTPEERKSRGKENSSSNDKFSKRKFTMKRKGKFQEADNNYQTAHYSDQINHSRSKREPDVVSWWIEFGTEEAQRMMKGICWENYQPASLPGEEITHISGFPTDKTKTNQGILNEWSEQTWENYLSSIKSSNEVCARIGPKKDPWGSLSEPNVKTELCVNMWPVLTAC